METFLEDLVLYINLMVWDFGGKIERFGNTQHSFERFGPPVQFSLLILERNHIYASKEFEWGVFKTNCIIQRVSIEKERVMISTTKEIRRSECICEAVHIGI